MFNLLYGSKIYPVFIKLFIPGTRLPIKHGVHCFYTTALRNHNRILMIDGRIY